MARENRFAAEAYEVGNANMEYDAALDALTIDADHENALGMEGVDMRANQMAALSASMLQTACACPAGPCAPEQMRCPSRMMSRGLTPGRILTAALRRPVAS